MSYFFQRISLIRIYCRHTSQFENKETNEHNGILFLNPVHLVYHPNGKFVGRNLTPELSVIKINTRVITMSICKKKESFDK